MCKQILSVLFSCEAEVRYNALYRLIISSYKFNRPTERKYSTNIKILVEWKLVKRREDKTRGGLPRTWLSLSEMGKLCLINDYEPNEYRKLYSVSSIIIFRAFQGVWVDEKGNDVLSLRSLPQDYVMISGITPDDIFNFKSRI